MKRRSIYNQGSSCEGHFTKWHNSSQLARLTAELCDDGVEPPEHLAALQPLLTSDQQQVEQEEEEEGGGVHELDARAVEEPGGQIIKRKQ